MKTVAKCLRWLVLVFLLSLMAIAVGCGSKVTLSTMAISPTKVAPGQPVTIAVNVLNSGTKQVDYKLDMLINDSQVESQQVTIGPGNTETVAFHYSPESLGTYTAKIGEQSGTFAAVKPATFNVGALNVEPATLTAGHEIKISALIKNDGELAGDFSSVFKFDGKEISTETLTIEPGESKLATVNYESNDSGTHTIDYCGINSLIKLLRPAEYKTTSISVSPSSVMVGESATVKTTITNSGEVAGTTSIGLKTNGTEISSKTITLDPGTSTNVDFTISRDEAGSLALNILGSSIILSVVGYEEYESSYFGYKIAYPPDLTLDDSDDANVFMDTETGGINVNVDHVPVGITPKYYFDSAVEQMKKQYPDYTTSSVTDLIENGTVIGYKYDYSHTANGKKWLGKGLVIKKAGLGFNVVYGTLETDWQRSLPRAVYCNNSFSNSYIASGSFSGPTTGISLTLPTEWCAIERNSSTYPVEVLAPFNRTGLTYRIIKEPFAGEMTAQQYIQTLTSALTKIGYQAGSQGTFQFNNGIVGYEGNYAATTVSNVGIKSKFIAVSVSGRIYAVYYSGVVTEFDALDSYSSAIARSLVITSPGLAGINKNETLFLLAGEIPTLDPAVSEETPEDEIGALFSGLVKIDSTLKVVPDIAERWTVSTDGKIYTFYLRKTAKFHDGKQITAVDVKYSWERACDPTLKSAKAKTFLNDIVGANDRLSGKTMTISGIKVIDDYTLEVTIDSAKQYFLSKLAQPVAYIVDKNNVAQGNEWWEKPNGTGPFKLKSWVKDEILILERYDAFYLGTAKLKNIVFKQFAGYGLMLYENGDIDITGVGTSDLDRVKDPSNPLNTQLLSGTYPAMYYVGFNVTKAPFDDAKVREAFALAIDVNKIIEVTLKNNFQRASGYIPSGIPGYDSSLQPFAFDVTRAKQLIAESKYKGSANLPPITVYVLYQASSAQQAIISMWQQNLGVQVQVETISEYATYFERMRRDEFQVHISGWGADFIDAQNFLEVLFFTTSSENSFGYSNPIVDAALITAAADPNQDSRTKKYQDVQKLILADLPAIPLYQSPFEYTLVKPYVKGFQIFPIAVNQWLQIYVEPH